MRKQVEWEISFRSILGEVMREIRRERSLSQEALAAASDVSVNHISLMERGCTTPTLLLLFQLAMALQISPTEVVQRVETRVLRLARSDNDDE